MSIAFTPLVNFHDTDLRSDYLVGLHYTVREGNGQLASKVQEWVAAGKVRVGTAQAPIVSAKLAGSGAVTSQFEPTQIGARGASTRRK